MPRLKEQDYTYFTTVRGMCRNCRKIVPARVFFRDDQVWQQSLCESCENIPAKIAEDSEWYLRQVLSPLEDASPLKFSTPPRRGCPHDCGPCSWHASGCKLPVFSITNACNLNCPICFTYNRSGKTYHMSKQEMANTLDWIVESSGEVDLINITGGEPTLHPDLEQLLSLAKRPGIGRITMNSNGIRLAEDPQLCRMLAELDVCVVLSFNTFDPQTSIRIHGKDLVETKLRAIENLSGFGVRMTLLNVMIRDVNEDAFGKLMDLMMTNDSILSITVQTMTHTGQGGSTWPEKAHIPVDEATGIVCRESGGRLKPEDFMPRPGVHPLCYSLCYLIKNDNSVLPLLRNLSKQQIARMLGDSYLIRTGGQESCFRELIDRLYASGDNESLAVFRKLIEQLFPERKIVDEFRRQRIAERAIRTIYIHSHMDEDNFDCSRAMMCGDLVPSEPGKLISACTYNLFYRQQDSRFYHAED